MQFRYSTNRKLRLVALERVGLIFFDKNNFIPRCKDNPADCAEWRIVGLFSHFKWTCDELRTVMGYQ